MPTPDRSQSAFCSSDAKNIRLLAPAGCGKTSSLLHRCCELVQQSSTNPRFLLITFTNAAAEEIKDRQASDPAFASLKDRLTVMTLNAWGWRRIRNNVNSAQLLTNSTSRHFAVFNQLRPVWLDNEHIAPAIRRGRRNTRTLLDVMDNLKSMGFDHTVDTSFSKFQSRMQTLIDQGASWRIQDQFDSLTRLRILDVDGDSPSYSAKEFYDRFFKFWRDATASLLSQSTFTFEDQKYQSYLDLKSPGPDGKRRPFISGAAQYHHVLVDEFQDINPLDLALIRAIVERNRASLTIVGDDDQAIFEWRGASPEFILRPQQYFGMEFKDYQLQINYRSPSNIVNHSQKLIAHNKNRVDKKVRAVRGAGRAKIQVKTIDSISDRLKYVTEIVRDTTYPGKVAVIGHRRSHLIPYQIYFAGDGAPFQTAADLDVFRDKALEDFTDLLDVWESSSNRRRTGESVSRALKICNLVKRFPLNRRDEPNLRRHMARANPRSVSKAVASIIDYSGPELSGRSHSEIHEVATQFLGADSLGNAISQIDDNFAGLSFDYDKREDSIWHTAPPMLQLAEIADSEGWDASDLIDRIEDAKNQLEEYQALEDINQSDNALGVLERPLHLMTAWRAKGKEFDTVILLDTVEGMWPDYRATDERELEAERRLFYVAFTRAQKQVIMIKGPDAAISPFVDELELPKSSFR